MKYKILAVALLFICMSASAIHFGKKATANICFTPGGQCADQVIHEIDGAQVTIKVQAYVLTNPDILAALANAKARGVFIRVVLDKSQVTDGKTTQSAANYLKSLSIPVWIDYKPAIAHNKIILIDDDITILGSYNYSEAAQNKNAENLCTIVDRQFYRVYDRNFEKRLKESTKYE
jgi:phosphatidylserine/phosphatidylglycerophosphate/cardiolipin synthase-like enzyme